MEQTSQIKTVAEFKTQAKKLIKTCKFKEAQLLVNSHYKSLEHNASVEDKVTLCHWVTRIALESCDLRQISTSCLVMVNTLKN
jgi:hypothetical protein